MGNLLSTATVGSNSDPATILRQIFNATVTVEETYTKNAIEEAIPPGAIPMELLIALGAEWKYSHNKALAILRSTSAITSVISSSIFIWMIMRSHDRLSTTQHRLLLGLCISDILSSLSQSTFNAMAPSDNDYMAWNVRGNQDTCTAMGFLKELGGYCSLYYNASLNIYFLAVVKYKKSDEFIRAKIEPFLHGIPIAVALSLNIYRLVKKQYNDAGGDCIVPINEAPHCLGYDVGEIREGFEIPCWRGVEGSLTLGIIIVVLIFIPTVIMIISLGMIYLAVKTQEKKLARYGAGAIRSNLQQQSTSTPQQHTIQDEQSSGIWGRISTSITALSTSLGSRAWSSKKKNTPVTRSNNVQSHSRAVMHKALGYTFAWLLSWGFALINVIIMIATGGLAPLVLIYLFSMFLPLQGLFNLLIFMHPKVMAAKKSKNRGGETTSWCKALSIAFWSKGKGSKNQGIRTSNLRQGTSSRRPKKAKNEDAVANNVKSPMFGRITKKKKKKRTDTPQEEEKCEIQVPDNLNAHKTKAKHSAASTAIYAPNISPPSMETTATRAMNASVNDMKKVDFGKSINVGHALCDVLEDPDEDSVLNQDKEEEMEKIEEENVDIVRVVTDSPVSVDVKEEGEISMENQSVRDAIKANVDPE